MSDKIQEEGHGDEVFVLIEMYYPKEGRLEDLMKITKASAKMIEDKPGMIQTQVLRPKSAKDPISSVTIWHSQAEFQTFMKSDEVKALLKSEDLRNVQDWSSEIKTMMFDQEAGWHSS